MKAKYYWTHDSTGEVCEYEKVKASENVTCYHCERSLVAGHECVKLKAADGDVYWLHPECAKDSVDIYA